MSLQIPIDPRKSARRHQPNQKLEYESTHSESIICALPLNQPSLYDPAAVEMIRFSG